MKQESFAIKFNLLRGTLLMRNMTIDEWAVSEGYNPQSVRTVIRRHFGKHSRLTGIQTREILQKLEAIIAAQPEASHGK